MRKSNPKPSRASAEKPKCLQSSASPCAEKAPKKSHHAKNREVEYGSRNNGISTADAEAHYQELLKKMRLRQRDAAYAKAFPKNKPVKAKNLTISAASQFNAFAQRYY